LECEEEQRVEKLEAAMIRRKTRIGGEESRVKSIDI